MTAQVIRFQNAAKSAEQLERIGLQLTDAMPLPSRDAELAMPTTMAEHLLGSYDDGLCDSLLARVEERDRDNRQR